MHFIDSQLVRDRAVADWCSHWASSIDLRTRIEAFVRAFGPMTLPDSPLYHTQRETFLNYHLDSSKIVVSNFTATSITLSVPGIHLGAGREKPYDAEGNPVGGTLILMPYGLGHVHPQGEQISPIQNLFGPAYTQEQYIGDARNLEINDMKYFRHFGLGRPAPGSFRYRSNAPHGDVWKQFGAGVAAPQSQWQFMLAGNPNPYVTVIFDKAYVPPPFVVGSR